MKKLFSMLLIATLSLGFVSCGDNKDEPEVPDNKILTSVHENESDGFFVFDIITHKDKGIIYMYNMQFAPRAPKMDLRAVVPMTKDNKTYIMTATDLVIDMDMPSAGGWTPMTDEIYRLNNLQCTVNPSDKTYSISFDAHGGHFEESGKLE